VEASKLPEITDESVEMVMAAFEVRRDGFHVALQEEHWMDAKPTVHAMLNNIYDSRDYNSRECGYMRRCMKAAFAHSTGLKLYRKEGKKIRVTYLGAGIVRDVHLLVYIGAKDIVLFDIN